MVSKAEATSDQGVRLARAFIHLDRLTRNLRLLEREAGGCVLWPVIKGDAYGHGALEIARHLTALGHRTLCVADVAEGEVLVEGGVKATIVILSATLPEHSEALVTHGFEPVVCDLAMVEALNRDARHADRGVAVHLAVDTGMGRIGIRPDEVHAFMARCRDLPALRVKGLMSHFPRADEADKSYSLAQIERFNALRAATAGYGIEVFHLANSAAVFDLPDARFDAVRPGIAMYGLAPSSDIANPRVHSLEPVLEWKTRVTFLKDVPAGTGLSYGHDFHTREPSLIATVPLGYADGFSRNLSNGSELLVGGRRCPQVGRVTMDMSLVDVSALRGRVAVGDEAVILGRQGNEEITADELAKKLSTINYEVVTRIGPRVPRILVREDASATR